MAAERKRVKWAWLFAASAWTVTIPVLSLLPAALWARAAPALRLPGADKVVHFLLYAIHAALLAAAWRAWRPTGRRRRRMAAAFLTATAYGVLMEVLQGACTASRTFSWGDMAANAVGAAAAVFAVGLFDRTRGV